MLTWDSFASFAKYSFMASYRFTARWLCPAMGWMLAGIGVVMIMLAFIPDQTNTAVLDTDVINALRTGVLMGAVFGFGAFTLSRW
jgi:hypothetical protein